MLFLEHIADELAVEGKDVIRWKLQADLASGRLVLTEVAVINGTLHHTWTFSVLSRDLDPSQISLQPEDSSGVRYLNAISVFYRKAVEGTCVSSHRPLRQEQFVKLSLPMAGDPADPEQIARSLRDFLVTCGARPPAVRPEIIREQLALLHAAIAPATRLFVPNERGTECIASLSDDRLLLFSEMRPKQSAPSRRTFELLSLDTKTIHLCKGTGGWVVTLSAVERIETTLWEISPGSFDRECIMRVLFPTQVQAERFAATCVRVVPEIQQRLYAVHSEN
ncbi:MAG: hypothetical protein KJ070_21930 [Verrucomicrobia bacterium]|nr:hypothetical protein [Verrucomicrobiota bacterium]